MMSTPDPRIREDDPETFIDNFYAEWAKKRKARRRWTVLVIVTLCILSLVSGYLISNAYFV